MESLNKFVTSIGSLALGEVVGIFTDEFSRLIEQRRVAIGLDNTEVDSLFDNILDVAIELALLSVAIQLVQKAVPSTVTDLNSLLLFQMGLIYSQTRLPTNLKAIAQKLSMNDATRKAELTEMTKSD